MEDKKTGYLAQGASLALVASVLGSLLTLLVTSNLSVPIIQNSAPATSPHGFLMDADLQTRSGLDAPMDKAPAVYERHEHASLNQALEAASQERAQLAQVLARLTQQIESIESDLINRSSRDALLPDNTSAVLDGQQGGFASGNSDRGTERDTVSTLVAAGLDTQSAQALKTRQDQFQLARLDLFDTAEREGWARSERFSEQLAQLDEQRPDMRGELGDDAYDRYLFESGLSNRVSIISIIPGSQAELAGVQVGDIVMSYGNTRVFTTTDLQQATRAGQRGEPVTLSVQRQTQPLFIDVSRGPLGVSLNPVQQNPS